MTRTTLFAILALAMCGCSKPPTSSAPPEQRAPSAVNIPNPKLMLEMNDPEAAQHIVKDIHERAADAPWRWTAEEPTVKLVLPAVDGLKFSTDFAIWDDGFKTTGPITLTFRVNGHELDKVRYTEPGSKHYEKPVPADWLVANGETTVSIAIDKVYVSPKDGFKAGIILSRIGFVR